MPTLPLEISARADEWNSDDTLAFRNFLDTTKTGKKLLPKLLESTPVLLPGGETNALAVRSGEVRGIQIIAKAFIELAFPPPEPSKQSNPYPALEDDDAHNDGLKLNPQ